MSVVLFVWCRAPEVDGICARKSRCEDMAHFFVASSLSGIGNSHGLDVFSRQLGVISHSLVILICQFLLRFEYTSARSHALHPYALHQAKTGKQEPKTTASGPLFFGLKDAAVARAVSNLPNANLCTAFLMEEEPGTTYSSGGCSTCIGVSRCWFSTGADRDCSTRASSSTLACSGAHQVCAGDTSHSGAERPKGVG